MKSPISKRLLALLSLFVVIAAACGTDEITDTAAAVPDGVEEVVEGEDEAMEDDEEAMEDDAMEDEEAMEDDAMEDDEAMEDDAMEDEEAMEDDAMEDASHDLNLVQSDLGQILTDAGGYTLYLFTNDEQWAGTSTCEGDCLAAWPAVGEITAPSGALDADLIGSIERSDGSIQATYNGWPLYRFANDAAPGDTNGQGVNDIWWVLDAAGNAIA